MFGALFLYRIRSLEKQTKIITIDMRSWKIKTDLIEKVSYSDKLIATIKKSHIFSLSWKQSYYLLLTAHSRCYSTSHQSKVTNHRFTWFWILCPIWVRVYYNRFIAESIIDYLILVSIKQISAEMQLCSIMLIWGIYHLLSKSDCRKSYVRT